MQSEMSNGQRFREGPMALVLRSGTGFRSRQVLVTDGGSNPNQLDGCLFAAGQMSVARIAALSIAHRALTRSQHVRCRKVPRTPETASWD
jgi:hypothetical protein